MKAKAVALSLPQPISVHRALVISFLTVISYFLLCFAAFAFDCDWGSVSSPMGDVLCQVVFFMYGNLGKGLATLGVLTLGIGALLNKVSWGMALTVGVGISVLFGAETIASLLLCGRPDINIC